MREFGIEEGGTGGGPGTSGDQASPEEIVARVDALARHEKTRCGDGEMAWRIWGKGPPLVLLHGSFGSWTHWIRNIPTLSRYHQVIAADLPGMGDSAEPAEPFSVESLAGIVSDGLDVVLPPDAPFHLAGFSFGGIVGGHVVLNRQHRALSYTACGSNGLGLSMAPRQGMARPSRSMEPAEIVEVHRNNLGVIMFGDRSRIDDLAVYLQIRNTARARIRSGEIPKTDTLSRALRQMKNPVHGIWGDRDATAGAYLEERRSLFREIAPAQNFHVISGAGHWACFEASDRVNDILLDITAGPRNSAGR